MRLGKTAKRHQGGFEHDSADDDRLDGPVSRRVGRDCAQLTLGETIGEMGVRCENIGITAPAQLAQRNQCSGERVTRGGLYCWHVPTKPTRYSSISDRAARTSADLAAPVGLIASAECAAPSSCKSSSGSSIAARTARTVPNGSLVTSVNVRIRRYRCTWRWP
jgi:hypothetical protein